MNELYSAAILDAIFVEFFDLVIALDKKLKGSDSVQRFHFPIKMILTADKVVILFRYRP